MSLSLGGNDMLGYTVDADVEIDFLFQNLGIFAGYHTFVYR